MVNLLRDLAKGRHDVDLLAGAASSPLLVTRRPHECRGSVTERVRRSCVAASGHLRVGTSSCALGNDGIGSCKPRAFKPGYGQVRWQLVQQERTVEAVALSIPLRWDVPPRIEWLGSGRPLAYRRSGMADVRSTSKAIPAGHEHLPLCSGGVSSSQRLYLLQGAADGYLPLLVCHGCAPASSLWSGSGCPPVM
jgi:hypothetical protein